MDENGILKWRFDVSTFRLIGRDLITDRVTALFELIKNCYDANATEVRIEFSDVSKGGSVSSISISDNGVGMSLSDIRDKWMVIGTSNKRRTPFSAEPMKRRCVGEKGIGRFAVDKLGDKLTIYTKNQKEALRLKVIIDWDNYYNQSQNNSDIKLFTDIENEYSYIPESYSDPVGTTLVVSQLRDIWTKSDIDRLLNECSKIVNPFAKPEYPFRINVIAPDFDINSWAEEYSANPTELATVSAVLEAKDGKQQCLLFDESTGKFKIEERDLLPFGGVGIQLFYFDAKARSSLRKQYPNVQLDGVKIYRDGIITTPFAEQENDDDKKRDILGIDKRLWVSLFDKVSTRELIGIVNISKDDNPQIIDATNRQDFSDTPEYRELKDFILHQIYALDQYKIYVRKKRSEQQTTQIQSASADLADIVQTAEQIAKDHPELSSALDSLKKRALHAGGDLKKAVKEQADAEEERLRHENMYMRIMSRQEDAINVTHAVKTSMGKIQRQARFFKDRFPNEALNEYFLLYAKQIHHEMVQLDRATDELFNYSKTNLPFTDIDIKQLVEYLLKSYTECFEDQGIKLEINIEDKLILNCNEMFFYDIVQNITDNAIKAMIDSKTKIFRCTVKAHDDMLSLDFSDTGCGIPVEKREWVFGIYNTTTEEQGGGGIGLYAVRLRVNALKGRVFITDSEFAPLGTTVRIELPFKK